MSDTIDGSGSPAASNNDVVDTVMSIYANYSGGERHVGIAVLSARPRNNMSDSKFATIDLFENLENEYYTLTETIVVQKQPNRVRFYNNALPEIEAKKLIRICEATQTEVKLVSKKPKDDIVQDVRTLAGEEAVNTFADIRVHKKYACFALSMLIQNEQLVGNEAFDNAILLQTASAEGRMRLDNAAVRALNLLPTRKSDDALSHLHGLLSQGCWSKGGMRTLKQWLLAPLLSVQEIETRQSIVHLFVQGAQLRDALREKMRIPDLHALNGRLFRRHATLMDVLRLYHFVQLIPDLIELLEQFCTEHSNSKPNTDQNGDISMSAMTDQEDDKLLQSGIYTIREQFVARLQWANQEFSKLTALIEQVVEDVSAPDPRINPKWDTSLAELANELDSVEEHVTKASDKVLQGWASGLDVKCERDKQRGYVFRAAKKHDKIIRKQAGVMVCAVLKDGIYFTTKGSGGLHELGQQVKSLNAEYSEKQRSLISHAIDIVRSYSPVLEAVSVVISELDALQSMAHLAVFAPIAYVRPQMSPLGQGDLIIRQARHPVMEVQENVTFIPNDYIMYRFAQSKDSTKHSTQQPSHFHMITGPNMGGKSTYIRQLGLLVVLGQIGSFVPATHAEIPVLDCILARVGAGDSQLRGVSTFMAEMLEASCILHTATCNSLVIIDELGRGTSTYDGFGLAWAISEHLALTTRCFTLFATHFHELTALEKVVAGVKNRHVTAHTSTGSITMLYNVMEGACPSSFGIHVAEIAEFPAEVIENARKKANELESLAERGRALLQQTKSGSLNQVPAHEIKSTEKCNLMSESVVDSTHKKARVSSPLEQELQQLLRQNQSSNPTELRTALKQFYSDNRAQFLPSSVSLSTTQ